MRCVYCAGSYSDKNVMQVFENMRIGIDKCSELLLAGYAPFCPWTDYHFILANNSDVKFTVNTMYEYSLSWLAKSDVLYVLPNSENSKGTQDEISFAKDLNIPIVYSMEELRLVCGGK